MKGALAAAGAFDLACSTAAAHSASMPVLEQVRHGPGTLLARKMA